MAILSNSQIKVQIAPLGAELQSLVYKDKEYLWQADPNIWGRHAPVLFPIVGRVWNDTYQVNGQWFKMGQHGFARDMYFELANQTDDSLVMQLIDNWKSREQYPYFFCLEIAYKIIDKSIKVTWRVKNTDPHFIYFQIGAHPGFYYPNLYQPGSIHCYLGFDTDEELMMTRIREKGCVDTTRYIPLSMDKEGLLPVDDSLFSHDALIFENGQVKEVTMYDKEKKPYLRMKFDAPVLGIWSPYGKEAPFLCIEPWYGRCDHIRYRGEFDEKEWMQCLAPNEVFEASYTIEVCGE